MIESYSYRRNDDYLRDVARGAVPGASIAIGYGRRLSAAAEGGILWPDGAFALPPSTGVQLSVVSTSADDSAAGTGIRTLEIHYLDTALDLQVETVVMNGLTPVLTTATNIRAVQCMHMLSWGTLVAAAGNISAGVGVQNYSYIAAGDARCSSSVRMVPRGKRLLVMDVFAGSTSGTAAGAVEMFMVSTYFEGHDYTDSSVFMPYAAGGFQDNAVGMAFHCPFPLYEGTAFGLAYTVDKASVAISGSWFGILEDL